jgi:hypothetical protein
MGVITSSTRTSTLGHTLEVRAVLVLSYKMGPKRNEKRVCPIKRFLSSSYNVAPYALWRDPTADGCFRWQDAAVRPASVNRQTRRSV